MFANVAGAGVVHTTYCTAMQNQQEHDNQLSDLRPRVAKPVESIIHPSFWQEPYFEDPEDKGERRRHDDPFPRCVLPPLADFCCGRDLLPESLIVHETS